MYVISLLLRKFYTETKIKNIEKGITRTTSDRKARGRNGTKWNERQQTYMGAYTYMYYTKGKEKEKYMCIYIDLPIGNFQFDMTNISI